MVPVGELHPASLTGPMTVEGHLRPSWSRLASAFVRYAPIATELSQRRERRNVPKGDIALATSSEIKRPPTEAASDS